MTTMQGELHKVLGGTAIDDRVITGIWFFLKIAYPASDLGEYKSLDMENKMAHFISNHSNLVPIIEQHKIRYFLPSVTLRWITEDEIQHAWLTKHILSEGWQTQRLRNENETTMLLTPDNLVGRERMIAMIDLWIIEPHPKLNKLANIEKLWIQHKKKNHKYDWFIGADETQKLLLAWDLTSKKHPSVTETKAPFNSLQELLIFFDNSALHEAEKTLLIDSIKKRWSQNQYREKMRGKRQYNFILSEKTITRLDKLADTFDLRRVEVLDILLRMEEKEGCYLPEGLKPRTDN